MGVLRGKVNRIAVVSRILPETNYSGYLIGALQKLVGPPVEVLIYTDKNEQNLKTPLKNIKLVWSKNILFPFQVLMQAKRDCLDLIHLQHEINMFGGPLTALVFPLLPIFLKILNIKTVITIHAVVGQSEIDERFLRTFFFPVNRFFIPLLRFFFFYLYFLCVKVADTTIVHASTLKEILVREYHAQSSKVMIIPIGVPECDPKSDSVKINTSWLPKLKHRKIILYFGYLVRRKGLEDLIGAFKTITLKYPEYVLVLAGGTLQKDYENELRKRAEKQESVVFTSFVSSNELKWLLRHCEFVVLPATYSIAASGPLAEAISLKKPVIVPKLGVFKEEMEDGVIGLQYEPLSQTSLARSMMKLVSNGALREKFSQNMQKKYLERIWPKIAQKTINLYTEII